MPATEPERQLAAFIAKFTPEMGKLIRAARAKMRAYIPQALELVYDNYNFFVIGYGPNEKAGAANQDRVGDNQYEDSSAFHPNPLALYKNDLKDNVFTFRAQFQF